MGWLKVRFGPHDGQPASWQGISLNEATNADADLGGGFKLKTADGWLQHVDKTTPGAKPLRLKMADGWKIVMWLLAKHTLGWRNTAEGGVDGLIANYTNTGGKSGKNLAKIIYTGSLYSLDEFAFTTEFACQGRFAYKLNIQPKLITLPPGTYETTGCTLGDQLNDTQVCYDATVSMCFRIGSYPAYEGSGTGEMEIILIGGYYGTSTQIAECVLTPGGRIKISARIPNADSPTNTSTTVPVNQWVRVSFRIRSPRFGVQGLAEARLWLDPNASQPTETISLFMDDDGDDHRVDYIGCGVLGLHRGSYHAHPPDPFYIDDLRADFVLDQVT